MSRFYNANSGNQDRLHDSAVDFFQKMEAVRKSAKEKNIVEGDPLDQLDRPLCDLTCEVGGIAVPIYWKIHPKHKQTKSDTDLLMAMCCSFVITGQPVQEAR